MNRYSFKNLDEFIKTLGFSDRGDMMGFIAQNPECTIGGDSYRDFRLRVSTNPQLLETVSTPVTSLFKDTYVYCDPVARAQNEPSNKQRKRVSDFRQMQPINTLKKTGNRAQVCKATSEGSEVAEDGLESLTDAATTLLAKVVKNDLFDVL